MDAGNTTLPRPPGLHPRLGPPRAPFGSTASPRWLAAGAIAAALGLILLMLGGTLLRSLYFDERAHVNYLWLITQGLRPYEDFWCSYPVAGYAFFRPILAALPENASAAVVLRICAALLVAASFAVTCAWSAKLSGRWWLPLIPAVFLVTADGTPRDGLARVLSEFRTDSLALFLAFVSIALVFTDARGWKRAFSVACAVVSLAVMPKYLYVLAGVHVLEMIGKLIERRLDWRTFFASVGGGFAGLLAVWLLLFFANASPGDTWHWAFLLQKHWQEYVLLTGNFRVFFTPDLLWPFLYQDYAMSACLAAGLGAFLICANRSGWSGQLAWVGYGLLAGVLYTVWQTRLPFEQYLPPVLLPLVFLFPFIGRLLPTGRPKIWVEGALFAVLAVSLFFSLVGVAQSLARTPLFDDLVLENHLHIMIPPDERTLGAFPMLFRRPVTFLTYDERWGNPPGFDSVVLSDPQVAREFTGARLAVALRTNPPALFELTRDTPLSWMPVVMTFLRDHRDSYQRVIIRGEVYYIRRDLYWANPFGPPRVPSNR